MKNILLLIFIVSASVQVHAGLFDDRYPSPKATAMGGAGIAANGDVWASYYNPANLSGVDRIEVGTSYLRLFNLSFFKNFFGAAAYPLPQKYGTISLSAQYFGTEYTVDNTSYNLSGEYTFAMSHGFYLLKDIHSSLALGYSLKAYHWNLGESKEFGDLGSATIFGIDVGLQASIYSRTYLGVYFLNINSPQVGAFTKHDLPQRIVIGIAYQPYDGVTTSLDFNRLIGVGDMQLLGGAEFNVFQNLFLRFGGTTNPNRFSAGLGIQYAQFKIDYALLTHNELGETHQFGLIVGF
jgi:hypothetical protein